MATMDRIFNVYSDRYESSPIYYYERGLIIMPSCRRKAARNIVRVIEVHHE